MIDPEVQAMLDDWARGTEEKAAYARTDGPPGYLQTAHGGAVWQYERYDASPVAMPVEHPTIV